MSEVRDQAAAPEIRAAASAIPASSPPAPSRRRVALIGAGYIADTHARALQYLPGTELTAIVEPDEYKRQAFARRWSVPSIHPTVDQLLETESVDAAHVLVPPPRHFEVASLLLSRGVPTLLEKPMAISTSECSALHAAYERTHTPLGVNHNYIHHPAHQQLKSYLLRRVIGPVRQFSISYSMPLRQLAAGQLSHWMFAHPANLLLEQAVHPLSQILDLFGPIDQLDALHPPALRKISGVTIIQKWAVSMICGDRVGELHLGFGQSYSVWQMVIVGDDGSIATDYLRNRIIVSRPGRYLDALDRCRSSAATAAQMVGADVKAALNYAWSQFGDKRRGDHFLASMVASAREFHQGLQDPDRRIDQTGSRVVAICEQMARGTEPAAGRRPRATARRAHDVLVIGGTGLIGRSAVRALVHKRRAVAVLARDVDAVPRLFAAERIGAFPGSVLDPDSLEAAMQGCGTVIDLASGAVPHSSELRRAIVEGARNVAERAVRRGVKHLVHVSSIAALHLGRHDEVIRGSTGVDPRRERRAEYARAKAEAEEAVRAICREHDVALTILRPGLVVGEARTPFHSGIGEFNCETHCLGWNRGRNPLPLVLVEDVADAIARVVVVGPRAGECFNLVGDVRLTAREYIRELGDALGRPLQYHPRPVPWLYGIEWLKWLVKRAVGGRDAAIPSYSDLSSRGLVARFDTSDVKTALGWQPEATTAGFIARALACHL
jgi:predicted dehydrogenase/nucleoside-diphosphate-sugar epimerase